MGAAVRAASARTVPVRWVAALAPAGVMGAMWVAEA